MPNGLRPSTRVYLFAAVAACVLFSGCVEESVQGRESTFRFSLWVPLAVLLGAMGLMAAGAITRVVRGRGGWWLLIGGLLALMVLVPGIFLDRIVVDDDHFDLCTGFWFSQTRHVVAFEDLKEIDLIVESGRKGRKNYYLNCIKRNGSVDKVPVGDLMKEQPLVRILSAAKQAGVPIRDMT